ncbi:MAG TPA: hypothetical protein GXZ22_00730 [Clostridiaceae bacterium]|nr:hypothetical protein [Clostridiaceae bacterium]
METLVLIVLSIFAFLGMSYTILYFLSQYKSTYPDKGLRIILYLPQNFSSKLEGIIRQIFAESIPRRLMADGKIYIMASGEDVETVRILERLSNTYPIEMLPEQISYCMITERENISDLQ